MNPQEKLQTAYHEAGHAIVTYLLAPTKDVFKATIIPHKEFLGMVLTPEKEETFIKDQKILLAEIEICLGSFVAERLKFGFTTAGVESDFHYALKTAHNMVWRWGMGKSGLLGNFAALAAERGETSNISEQTKARLDQDVQEILNNCLREVEDILTKETALLDRFANELLQKEELNYDEIETLFKEFGKSRPA